MTDSTSRAARSDLLAACLEAAVDLGVKLVPVIVERAGKTLSQQAASAPVGFGSHALPVDPGKMLARHSAALAVEFADCLWHEFGADVRLGRRPAAPAAPANPATPAPGAAISFDSLELMSEDQIDETIEFVRARERVAHVADTHLPPFTALICAVQGLGVARVSANPMPPEAWLRALRTAVFRCPFGEGQRAQVLHHLNSALAAELGGVYDALCQMLREQGVRPAGFLVSNIDGQDNVAMLKSGARGTGASEPGAGAGGGFGGGFGGAGVGGPAGPGVAPGAAAGAGGEPLLNVRALWSLLAQGGARAGAAAAATPPWGPPAGAGAGAGPDGDMTIPAALEVVQELNQVDVLVRRMADRDASLPPSAPGATGERMPPVRALSLEVVKLMIDNLVADPRLLRPVSQALRALEPALGVLALVDVRFFSDKAHPARRLIDEIVQRSLAWTSTEAPGFADFMGVLQQAVDTLSRTVIDSAEPFDKALAIVSKAWEDQEQEELKRRARAHQTLIKAVERNAMAQSLAAEWAGRPGMDTAPEGIRRFLRGPWAQVVAAARQADRDRSLDPGGFGALVDDLLWSVRPPPGGAHLRRLAWLVPRMLHTLRTGLASIDYPADATAQFLDELADIHQAAFRAHASAAPAAGEPAVPAAPAPAPEPGRPALELDDETPSLWLAPSEARESGFMGEEALDHPALQAAASAPAAMTPLPTLEPEAGAGAGAGAGWALGDAPVSEDPPPASPPEAAGLVASLQAGDWVDLFIAGEWKRCRLIWASPASRVFMFVQASGQSHSMTRSLMEKMVALGGMRRVEDVPSVDRALDSVAETALRNSAGAPPRPGS